MIPDPIKERFVNDPLKAEDDAPDCLSHGMRIPPHSERPINAMSNFSKMSYSDELLSCNGFVRENAFSFAGLVKKRWHPVLLCLDLSNDEIRYYDAGAKTHETSTPRGRFVFNQHDEASPLKLQKRKQFHGRNHVLFLDGGRKSAEAMENTDLVISLEDAATAQTWEFILKFQAGQEPSTGKKHNNFLI